MTQQVNFLILIYINLANGTLVNKNMYKGVLIQLGLALATIVKLNFHSRTLKEGYLFITLYNKWLQKDYLSTTFYNRTEYTKNPGRSP